MNRRTFTTLAAVAFMASPQKAAAQSYDPETCRYGGTMRTMFDMLAAGFSDLPSGSASATELAFGLYRLTAIGRAAHEVFGALTPAASMAPAHALLLESMAVIAAAEPDAQAAITHADGEARTRAMVAAERAWQLLTAAMNSEGTLPETGTRCTDPATAATPGALQANR